MPWLPGGTFQMGSDRFYPEERPVHRVTVPGFWMDSHPVTVEEFRRFVKATGYVTVAERRLERAGYPDADHFTSRHRAEPPGKCCAPGAARPGETEDTATSHLGFRCVRRSRA